MNGRKEKKMKGNSKIFLVLLSLLLLCVWTAMPVFADEKAGTGNVADAVENTWNDARIQIRQVVDNVVFPVINLILTVLFFVKITTAYLDYRKHGQFEWTAPAILLATLIFSLTCPLYLWSILGM